VLRYGAFYGPQALPRHDRDAAQAAVARAARRRLLCVGRPPGGRGGYGRSTRTGRCQPAYNIVDDEPARWGDVLDFVASQYGTPRPMRIPTWVMRLAAPYGAALMTRQSLRLSNAHAKRELG
jgi:nucleoside-diphosphate-sugar epimerase